jgi:16S rRNA processing protein RimM
MDQDKALGPILEVIEQPHQVLCRLEIDSKEVLIPINEQTLNKVDHKNRCVFLTLPDGLLEVYLG